jgi:hypothetical protein
MEDVLGFIAELGERQIDLCVVEAIDLLAQKRGDTGAGGITARWGRSAGGESVVGDGQKSGERANCVALWRIEKVCCKEQVWVPPTANGARGTCGKLIFIRAAWLHIAMIAHATQVSQLLREGKLKQGR